MTKILIPEPEEKRLLLILSPGWAPVAPYGLALLKAYLKSKGFYVKIIDLNLELHPLLEGVKVESKRKKVLDKGVKKIIREIDANKFSSVGFSVYYPSFWNGVYIAREIKKVKNDVRIIFGGPHLSYITKEAMDFSFIDVAIEGEGELPLLEYMEKNRGDKSIASSDYYYIRTLGKIVPPTKRGIINNLDEIPRPDYTDIKLKKYPLPSYLTSLSRGCVKNCAFCGEPNLHRGYRTRSIESIREEFVAIKKEQDLNIALITDTLINADEELLENFCRMMIDEDIGIYWAAEALPDISKKMAKNMFDAGCRFLYISPETGSQKIANLMGKGVNIKATERTLKILKDVGITNTLWLIFGFPFETEEDMRESFMFADRVYNYSEEIIFCPFGLARNTPIYSNPKRYGIKDIEEHKYRLYCYYTAEDQQFQFKNQLKTFLDLWGEYSRTKLPENGAFKDIIDMFDGKNRPTKDLEFLIGEKYEEIQFVFKEYGQKGSNYSYIDLFKESFKEVRW